MRRSDQGSIRRIALCIFLGIIAILPRPAPTSATEDPIKLFPVPLYFEPHLFGITAGPDGALWFTYYRTSPIVESSGFVNGNCTSCHTGIWSITTEGTPTPESPIEIGSFCCVTDITTGPDGAIWFTEYTRTKDGHNQIGRFVPPPGCNMPADCLTEFAVPTPNAVPFRITVGSDNNLWFTEYLGNRIGRLIPALCSTSTECIKEFPIPSINSVPYEITTGPDGNLWFTEHNANRIGRLTPAGTFTEFAIPTLDSDPNGITAGPDGNLWFTEHSGDKIGRITPTGNITEFDIKAAKGGTDRGPARITVGPDGNLWFTEQSGDKIGRITRTGNITEFDIVFNQLSSFAPHSITVGSDGNLWFTCYNTAYVGRFRLWSDYVFLPLVLR